MTIEFSLAGYLTETVLLERTASGAFDWKDQVVKLARSSEAGVPWHGENSILYVLPYQVAFGSAISNPDQMQTLITEYLSSGLDIYLQEISYPVPLVAFGLERVQGKAPSISNTGEVLDFGVQRRDALAIVGGHAGVRMAADEAGTVELSSRYVIVPSLEGATRFLRIDDTLPVNLIRAREIAERLNRLWGRNTVLAISIAAFNQARLAERADRLAMLNKIKLFLEAELYDAEPGEPLVSDLKDLLQQVTEESQR